MYHLCLLMLLTGMVCPCFSQDTMEISVRPESTLKIHGKTNVNSFTCSQTYIKEGDGLMDIRISADGESMEFIDTEVSIPVKEFDCGHKIMTRDFQEILQADKNPYLRVKLNSIQPDGRGYLANVSIRLAGVSHNYYIPVTIRRGEGVMTGEGQREVKFSEYNLEPPVKFLGMVRVKEELNISFNIRITEIQ